MGFYVETNNGLKEVPIGKVETLLNNNIKVISDKDIVSNLKQQLATKDKIIELLKKGNDDMFHEICCIEIENIDFDSLKNVTKEQIEIQKQVEEIEREGE